MATKTQAKRRGRFFGGKSRSQKRAENNLGIIQDSALQNVAQGRCRTQKLEVLDKYFKSEQYDHLADWEDCADADEHIGLTKRKPKIIFPFSKVMSNRLSSKLVGQSTYPTMTIEDDPDTEEFLKLISKSAFIRPKILDMTKQLVAYTSSFVRFKIVEGNLKLEVFNSKWCYPEFDAAGNLEELRIQYVYSDPLDLDDRGHEKEKWFKLVLGKQEDTLFDNPEFAPGQEPVFQKVDTAVHNFGFVQGEWFRLGEDPHSPDGNMDIIFDLLSFIDALNYNLSQSDTAVNYGMDPQLIINGMDEDDLDELIKSSTKAWLMGREGKAEFAEVSGSGVQRAKEQRDDYIQRIQDIARIVLLDPEKIVGSAQSAKAMEVLHGPMVELINEIRPWIEMGLIKLHQKIIVALLIMNKSGAELAFTIPPGFSPKSLDISVSWPPVFEMTMQDLQQKVAIGVQLASGNIMSRKTVLKWLLKDFEGLVEDVDAEEAAINAQPQFGGFF